MFGIAVAGRRSSLSSSLAPLFASRLSKNSIAAAFWCISAGAFHGDIDERPRRVEHFGYARRPSQRNGISAAASLSGRVRRWYAADAPAAAAWRRMPGAPLATRTAAGGREASIFRAGRRPPLLPAAAYGETCCFAMAALS